MLGNVLIVGGTASIADAIVSAFGASALKLFVTYRYTAPANLPMTASAVRCDIRTAAGRAELVRIIEGSGAGLDGVIVLSGSILGKNLEQTTDEEMAELAAVNLTGPMGLLRDLLPSINPGARILLMSSIAGERGSFDPIYAATKGALIPFAKSLATWLGKRMTVTIVAPGAIEGSRMVNDMSAERVAHHRAATPTGELVNPQDLARILVDLAHPHWRHANGAVVRINGGAYV